MGIPGDGIRLRWHRPLPPDGEPVAVVLLRSGDRWFVSLQVQLPDAEAPAAESPAAPVGIVLGRDGTALSNGETVPTPRYVAEAAKSALGLSGSLAWERLTAGE